MNKFKDFLYNKNDILIVLIILLAAALIIYTRINAIMDYPEALAEKTAKQQQSEQLKTQTEETQASESSSAESTAASSGEAVSITITDSDNSESVADKLYAAGLVSSADDFQSAVNSAGKSGSIKSGTFQITKGSSNEEILNIIAN